MNHFSGQQPVNDENSQFAWDSLTVSLRIYESDCRCKKNELY